MKKRHYDLSVATKLSRGNELVDICIIPNNILTINMDYADFLTALHISGNYSHAIKFAYNTFWIPDLNRFKNMCKNTDNSNTSAPIRVFSGKYLDITMRYVTLVQILYGCNMYDSAFELFPAIVVVPDILEFQSQYDIFPK